MFHRAGYETAPSAVPPHGWGYRGPVRRQGPARARGRAGGQSGRGERAGGERAGSEEARALPFLAEDVLSEEGEDGLVPDPRVAGGEDPVVLVREVEELGLGAVPGQVPPQPQRLADR